MLKRNWREPGRFASGIKWCARELGAIFNSRICSRPGRDLASAWNGKMKEGVDEDGGCVCGEARRRGLISISGVYRIRKLAGNSHVLDVWLLQRRNELRCRLLLLNDTSVSLCEKNTAAILPLALSSIDDSPLPEASLKRECWEMSWYNDDPKFIST